VSIRNEDDVGGRVTATKRWRVSAVDQLPHITR